MGKMRSTSPISRRATAVSLLATAVSGCVARSAPAGPAIMPPEQDADAFVMPDGARLPYRVWRPAGEVRAVVLALHGFNDSRDAFEYPAPDYAAAGIMVYAPDQRGFGRAPNRGLWSGTDSMAGDAAEMVGLLRTRYPGVRLVLMGESMGGAVAMCAAAMHAPQVDAYVLLAPAVWGRARMNILMQSGLWLAATLAPGLAVGNGPVRVRPSDNMEALIRLSRDPLTLRTTRFDTLRGLVDLMDAALAAAPIFNAPGLFLYGEHDELVPPRATATIWRSLPEQAVRAFYPNGYHLLTRDLNRAAVNADVAAYVLHGTRPASAETAAQTWLATQT